MQMKPSAFLVGKAAKTSQKRSRLLREVKFGFFKWGSGNGEREREQQNYSAFWLF